MTAKNDWKRAKWIKKHGPTKVCDLPKWFDAKTPSTFFYRKWTYDSSGFPVGSPEDVIDMLDYHIDAYEEQHRKNIHAFRDWLEPVGVVVANIIALAALILSIIALRAA